MDRRRTIFAVGAVGDRASQALGAAADLQRFEDAVQALRLAASQRPDVLLLPAKVPGMDLLELLRMLAVADPRRFLPAIVVGQLDRAARLEALRLGADVLGEDADPEELAAMVERSVAARARLDALAVEAEGLQRLSVTDGLTQLYNYRFFQERLREEFRRAQRYGDSVALVLLDIDRFKNINDRFGHPVGDQVLREVGASMKRCLRETDVVCRYGGDEFCTLLPKTHFAGSLTAAERLRRDLASTPMGPGLTVTASIGVSGFPANGVDSPDQLLRTADEALYRAKRDGRNKVCLWAEPPPVPPPPKPE